MNKKELSQVYSLNREAEMYRRQIDALEAALQGKARPLFRDVCRFIRTQGGQLKLRA